MGLLKKASAVSFVILIARLVGALRDIVMFRVFGAGLITSAFVFGFTIPNLFRRLLGEGALTSALIPVFSQALQDGGEKKAFKLLNRVLTRLCIILICVIAIGTNLLIYANLFFDQNGKYYLCCHFCMILLPYVFFVCLAAVFSAIHNVFNLFLLATGNAILLNLLMAASMLLADKFVPESNKIYCLCAAVLLGGFLQMAILIPTLYKKGWRFKIDLQNHVLVTQFQRLFLPGVIGASVIQINIAISRAMAYCVNEHAVSTLYLSSRFTELPLGLFAVAITTVIFPNLTNAAVNGNTARETYMFKRGMSLILFLMIPSVFGILWLGDSMLMALFVGGQFQLDDVYRTLPVLKIYTIGLPFYAISAFIIKGFHVKKNTVTPMRISVINCITNILLTFILMIPFQERGIAAANIISAIIQVGILYVILRKNYPEYRLEWMRLGLWSMFIAAICMVTALYNYDGWICSLFEGRFMHIARLVIEIPFGAAVYFVSYFLIRFILKKIKGDKFII